MSLSTFCDIVWAEIWDDCPPMGDQARYRDIMTRLFIDGDEPHDITWVDEKGKTHRLTDRPAGGVRGKPTVTQMADLRALHDKLKSGREAAKQVASTPDG